MRQRKLKQALAVAMLLLPPVVGAAQQGAEPPGAHAVGHVNTIAALRALAVAALADRTVVVVDGFARGEDRGGGSFRWSAHATSPDDGGLVIAPEGGAGAGRWLRVLPEPGVISPLYYGARCDGHGDDSVAINKAIDQLRRQHSAGDMQRLSGKLRLPALQCSLRQSVNLTGLSLVSVIVEGNGGSLYCETDGQPCIDAMNSARLGLRDVNIYGARDHAPNIGLQVGRPTHFGGAAGMYLDHVAISGFFSFAAFYNLNAETQGNIKFNASNTAPNGYGAVYDGLNHFAAKSAFVHIDEPVDKQESFGDNSCINCRITSIGAGGVPVWAGGTSELTFENSYISNFATGVGVVLYGTNIQPSFGAHFEVKQLTHVFLLAGANHVIVEGLRYREPNFFAADSLFGLDSGVRAATLEDVDIQIGLRWSKGKWFDEPAKYTVSGRVSAMSAAGWEEPGRGFSGTECFAGKCVDR